MRELTGEYIKELSKQVELAAKKTIEKNGAERLPESFFKTYSAMANTNGGEIFIGITENIKGDFQVIGINDLDRVLEDLWNGLNNRDLVSDNVLTDSMVECIKVEGKSVIKVSVPRAFFSQLPVYLNGNPFTGTYQRVNNDDHKCLEESVIRMITAKVRTVHDDRILPKYDFSGLNHHHVPVMHDEDIDAIPLSDLEPDE